MKKSILNLGKELSKSELKGINGGIHQCQRLYSNYTLAQCNAVGGYFMTNRGCLVTLPGCEPILELID